MTLAARLRRPTRWDVVLISEFTFVSIGFYLPALLAGGLDARVYRLAAQAWLSGGDPLAAHLGIIRFAAPPLTLLVVAPFAWLPEPAFVAMDMAIAIASAVYALRKLGLPAWWLLFPPIFEGIVVGSLDLLVLALLVAGHWWSDVLATVAKVYALVPVLLLRRWRSAIVVGVFVVVSWPFLPWADYLANAGALAGTLLRQSGGGHSATAVPVLIPATAVALIVLGRKRSAWLAVPALWPATQVHYAVLAAPSSSRLMAAIIALPIPAAPAIAVIVEAARTLINRWRVGSAPGAPNHLVRVSP
jgi:hypothetical protein